MYVIRSNITPGHETIAHATRAHHRARRFVSPPDAGAHRRFSWRWSRLGVVLRPGTDDGRHRVLGIPDLRLLAATLAGRTTIRSCSAQGTPFLEVGGFASGDGSVGAVSWKLSLAGPECRLDRDHQPEMADRCCDRAGHDPSV